MLSIILALHTHPINLYVLNFACIFIYVHILHDIFILGFRLITHGCLLLARKRCKNSSRAAGDLTHNGRLNARENLGSLFDTRLSSMVEHTLFYLPVFCLCVCHIAWDAVFNVLIDHEDLWKFRLFSKLSSHHFCNRRSRFRTPHNRICSWSSSCLQMSQHLKC